VLGCVALLTWACLALRGDVEARDMLPPVLKEPPAIEKDCAEVPCADMEGN